MTYLVSTKDREGTKRARTFQGISDAVEFASAFPGLVRIQDLTSRENWIFLNGSELRGEPGATALREFENR